MNEDLSIVFSASGEKQLLSSITMLNTEIAKLSNSVAGMAANMDRAGKETDSLGTKAKGTSGAFAGLGGAIGQAISGAAIGLFVKESIGAFADFDQGLADLGSITGLTGKSLSDMGIVAQQMAQDVQGGAVAALKAMEAIGSAKPELLSSSAALTQVTKAANVLARASGDDLPQAAANLTGIMNQFGAGAQEANRYINALAAGSLAGSANITEVAETMKQAGAIASAFNLSIEETTAATEALADKSIKGAEAGTALRNILIRMAATKALPKTALDALAQFGVDLDVVSNKSLPFDARLKELSKVGGDTTAIVKIFGEENQAAAQILLNSTQRVEELTKAVTGSNTAYDQAKTRSETFSAQMERLRNTVNSAMIELGSAIAPTLLSIANGFMEAKDSIMGAIKAMLSPFADLGRGVMDLVGAFSGAEKGAVSFGDVLKFIVDASKPFRDAMTLGIRLLADVVGWFGRIANDYPVVVDAFKFIGRQIEYLMNPLKALTDAWAYLFGGGDESIGGLAEKTKSIIAGFSKEAKREFGATTEQIQQFAASFDVAEVAGMDTGDAIAFTKQRFEEFIHACGAATASTDLAASSLGSMGAKSIDAAGSINALNAQLKVLKDRFEATGSEAERLSLAPQIDDLEKAIDRAQNLTGITKSIREALAPPDAAAFTESGLDSYLGTISDATAEAGRHADHLLQVFNDVGTKGAGAANELGNAALSLGQRIEKMVGAETFNALKQGVGQMKSLIADFAASTAQSIGFAIGSAQDAGAAFKQAINALLVEVPKVAGMALLNAAAFPANAAIALPLAVAGLGLLGLSGLIKGVQSRKSMREEAEGNIPSATSVSASASQLGGLAALSAGLQQAPIVLNVTAEMDGVEMGGLIHRVSLDRTKNTLK